MKHNVTRVEEDNEPINFSSSVLGNYFLQLEPRNYQAKEVSGESDTQFDLLRFSHTYDIECNIVNLVTNVGNYTNQVVLEDRFWILYFDGSKTQEGLGDYCVLVDPERNKHYRFCRLGFKYATNTTKALVQNLKKSIELNVKKLKVFGDSRKNPFQQQLRETHSKMEPLIEKELKKLGLSNFKIYKDRKKVFL